jgi:hypothetical protein
VRCLKLFEILRIGPRISSFVDELREGTMPEAGSFGGC